MPAPELTLLEERIDRRPAGTQCHNSAVRCVSRLDNGDVLGPDIPAVQPVFEILDYEGSAATRRGCTREVTMAIRDMLRSDSTTAALRRVIT
jgi:hypothetical protein